MAAESQRDVNNNPNAPQSSTDGSAGVNLSAEQLQTVVTALGTLFSKANQHKPTTTTTTSNENVTNNQSNVLSQSNINFLQNLAQVLGTHIDEHLVATKEARIVPATTFHSASASLSSAAASTATNSSASASPTPMPVFEAQQPKTIYNNYFSKPIGIENYFTNMLNGDPTNKPRPSISTADQNSWKANVSDVGGGGVGVPEESIRINLPEILDQNDEITILRLLIKLLSSKVGRLSDEKRQLLEHLNELNDINIQMSYMIEHGLK